MKYKNPFLLFIVWIYSIVGYSQVKVVKHIQKITDKRVGSGVLVRIKNIGSNSVSAYTVYCGDRSYNYDGLVPGDSTAYSYIPSISQGNKIGINLILDEKKHFEKRSFCSNCEQGREIKNGKVTLLINTTYNENSLNTLYQDCKIEIIEVIDKE